MCWLKYISKAVDEGLFFQIKSIDIFLISPQKLGYSVEEYPQHVFVNMLRILIRRPHLGTFDKYNNKYFSGEIRKLPDTSSYLELCI